MPTSQQRPGGKISRIQIKIMKPENLNKIKKILKW